MIAAATTLLAAAPAGPPVPPDFPVQRAESSPGQVTFSHRRHLPPVQKCSLCHMRDFKMKRGGSGPITLAAKQDGKSRMSGAVVFAIDECDRCHK